MYRVDTTKRDPSCSHDVDHIGYSGGLSFLRKCFNFLSKSMVVPYVRDPSALFPLPANAIMSLWAPWCLKSSTSRLFAKPFFFQVYIKENIKAPRHWPLWGKSTGDRWISLTKSSNTENVSIWWRHHVNVLAPGGDYISHLWTRWRH